MSEKESGLNFLLEEYAAALEEWMRVHGSYAMHKELHLDVDSTEGGFWRAGYLQALHDLQSLIRDCDPRDTCTHQDNSHVFH